ncbi:uncharacterized protein LOC129802596 [Phlebotomus papatasi]|uniref:uncharacterized protein LOC129802596 n=1 Tax=Phlebotomus papatasi TaxID=29031 RepID=UPI0024837E89|nr:uncharacterized protein LOC129802596 [Phlebotomus papatasi]
MPRRRETPGSGGSIDTDLFFDSSTQAHSSYIGIKEVELMIPEFHGIEKDGKLIFASEWLDKIESLGKVYKWTSPQMLLYASLRVKGPALNWLDSSEGGIISWEVFKAELKDNFPQNIRESVVHEQLSNRKRRYNEALEEYYHDMVRMAKRIRLGDETIKEYLIKGLLGVNDRKVLRAVPQCSLPEVLRHMLKLEEDDDDLEKSNMADSSEDFDEDSDRSHPRESGSKEWTAPGDNSEQREDEKPKLDKARNGGCGLKGNTKPHDKPIDGDNQKRNDNSEKRRGYKCKEVGHLKKDCFNQANGRKDFHDRVVMGVLATRNKNNSELIKTTVVSEDFVGMNILRSLTRRLCKEDFIWVDYAESETLERLGHGSAILLSCKVMVVVFDNIRRNMTFLMVGGPAIPEDIV